MKVKILKSDDHTGVVKGEIYIAERARYDFSKVVLLRRENDSHDPECSEYISNVAVLMQNKWMVVDGGIFVEEKFPLSIDLWHIANDTCVHASQKTRMDKYNVNIVSCSHSDNTTGCTPENCPIRNH